MKTAVSIPDAVFAEADQLAERLGVSRSELYARAVAEFVAKHDQQSLTERLNTVHGPQARGLDRRLRRAQGRTLRHHSEW
jgi:metal-responsive CopG/Arc/MetJ family transcriptional regulator